MEKVTKAFILDSIKCNGFYYVASVLAASIPAPIPTIEPSRNVGLSKRIVIGAMSILQISIAGSPLRASSSLRRVSLSSHGQFLNAPAGHAQTPLLKLKMIASLLHKCVLVVGFS
eukprot:scaffold8924_cov106-Skeletonema_dohrnii-CCMP3373.AAC.5